MDLPIVNEGLSDYTPITEQTPSPPCVYVLSWVGCLMAIQSLSETLFGRKNYV
jgi:hypothetical protein